MFSLLSRLARTLGVAALAILVTLIAVPSAAQAHGGPFSLNIAPDGAGGLVVSAQYSEDGHPVTEVIDPVATAVSDDGSTVGPVSLISSGEGEGLWVTSEPFLPAGNWTVTVTTSTPSVATATTVVTVAELTGPEDTEELAAEQAETTSAVADDSAATPAQASDDSASPFTPWLWTAAALALAGLCGVIVWRVRAARARG